MFPLSWRSEARATLVLAGPLVLTNLAQAAIGATDVLLLGRTGAHALAAAALGTNLLMALLILGMGLMSAASPMIARELGRNAHAVREVRRTVRQAMWAAVAFVCPCWLLLWHSEAVFRAFGQDPALARDAAQFVHAMMWGLLPALWYIVLRAFVSALEQPAWALAVAIFAVLFNALANSVLIFGGFGVPALGLLGAGIGSAIANTVMFIGLAIVVARHPRFRRYRVFGRFWVADWSRFAAVWRLGLPIGITLFLEVTIFSAAVFLMGLIGEAALAAHAIAIQIASLTFMVPLGIAQAVTVRVGLAHGRGDTIGVTRAGWTAFALGVGFMACMALMMLVVPQTLVGLFIDTHAPANAAVVRLAISFLAVGALFQIADGAQVVSAGMLRGLHDTTLPMIFAALGYWVIGLPAGAVLAFWMGLGGVGIWIGLAIGLVVVALLLLGRWLRRERLRLA
jgi:MATE family multidrug resistance protein